MDLKSIPQQAKSKSFPSGSVTWEQPQCDIFLSQDKCHHAALKGRNNISWFYFLQRKKSFQQSHSADQHGWPNNICSENRITGQLLTWEGGLFVSERSLQHLPWEPWMQAPQERTSCWAFCCRRADLQSKQLDVRSWVILLSHQSLSDQSCQSVTAVEAQVKQTTNTHCPCTPVPSPKHGPPTSLLQVLVPCKGVLYSLSPSGTVLVLLAKAPPLICPFLLCCGPAHNGEKQS